MCTKVARDGQKVARNRGPIFSRFPANKKVARVLYFGHLAHHRVEHWLSMPTNNWAVDDRDRGFTRQAVRCTTFLQTTTPSPMVKAFHQVVHIYAKGITASYRYTSKCNTVDKSLVI